VLVSDILSLIDSFAPYSLAMDWDNSGFQAGDPQREVKRVALALDPTLEVLKAAAELKTELLITHHPLIYKPLTRLEAGSPVSDAIIFAIKNDITVISAHTNWDALGVASALGDILEIKRLGFLEPKSPDLLKLTVFTPKEATDKVLGALHKAGAGVMGLYERCSFKTEGWGTFLPLMDANPSLGTKGEQAIVREERAELILKASLRDKVTKALLETHPYETPAYDFYKVESPGEFGFGLIGLWDPPKEPLSFTAAKLGLKALNHTRLIPKRVSKVALMPGSGGSYLSLAKKAGAELLITGDLTHHDAQTAIDLGLGVIAAGHFETENPSLVLLKEKLERSAPELFFSMILAASPLSVWTNG
jgi:dinuclear metal center YbgI/SA1388 family protein